MGLDASTGEPAALAESPAAGVIGTIIAALLALVIGAFIGGLTTFVHRQWALPLGSITVPWGLVSGLAIIACATAGFRLAFGSRLVACGAAVGVILAISVLSLKSPGGSVVVQNDALGWGWSIGAAVVVLLAVGWPGRRRRANRIDP